jgi:hypothetical protein
MAREVGYLAMAATQRNGNSGDMVKALQTDKRGEAHGRAI